MRTIKVAAAQLGPIQRSESRGEVVVRLISLLEGAAASGCGLVVFPELALTTFFPRWFMGSAPEVDAWFPEKIGGRVRIDFMDGTAEEELVEDCRGTVLLEDLDFTAAGSIPWTTAQAGVDIESSDRVSASGRRAWSRRSSPSSR